MNAKIALGVLLFLATGVRVYLGIDHFSDDLFGAILGVAVPIAVFRAFAPSEVYPIRYGKRGKAAHLDVGGRRGDAIRSAMNEQLGLTVLDMKPVGLEGSGGSTPLKMKVLDDDGVVQARPLDAVRPARGRDRLHDGPPVRGVRGLHAAAARRVRVLDTEGARHRRDHPR
jgi:hypothetical protein